MADLWIGLCTNEELRQQIKKNGGKFLSASVSQDNIYNGLVANGLVLDSINAPQINAYPDYKEKRIHQYCWTNNGTKHASVGFLNLKYASVLYKKKALKKVAHKWAENCKEDSPKVFVYQMHSPFMAAAMEVKRILPNAQIILIVPDLPQYMDLGMSRFKALLKKIDWLQIQIYMKYVDRYILYSKHMAEFLKLADGTWMVIEGTIDMEDIIYEEPVRKKKAIMYSGLCDLRYGIPLLLEAFEKLDEPDFELWITGVGNAVDLITEAANRDHRIHFFGYFPSRRDMLMKQKEASIMINMRMPDEEASAYCFPSKIFEYMLSGNPVLSFRIPGIPDEYFSYLFEINEPTVEAVRDAIKKVLEMPEDVRNSIGKRGRSFIINNKNSVEQTKKIQLMMNGMDE
mgnify:CR=1 FL=1